MQILNDLVRDITYRVDAKQTLAPADHLATDETMLLIADEVSSVCDDHSVVASTDQSTDTESIRVWQFDRPTVVLGRSSRVNDEVDREFCRQNDIPILRRCSGGASVVGGPGCLMYSVVLSFKEEPQLQKIDAAHDHVMTRVLRAAQVQVPDAKLQGICDLTWNNRKCSGNSLRISKRHLLYHGTILFDADLDLLARCLTGAPRQPEYRDGRNHSEFVTNAPIDPDTFASDLADQFGAIQTIEATDWIEHVDRLRRERYDLDSWHFRH
ncbi:lipoate--protein ligase family protein [Rubripirellula reticaptiva]|uniref:Putative lipoate-protein ligase A n=1 Tax=Rubripirellula reticaptiva TaxID=2528013 RepID=A0A5C6FBA6_9BACT|nr:lipoate--protein ligase family protein [Rubripirellula reticaptiva]TWU58062.1 putative lipoate-protein ligase A [Rubripirellula reticaptiva]